MPLDGLGALLAAVPPELQGAGLLAAVYSVVRIVSAIAKALQDRRIDAAKLVLAQVQTRQAMEEATQAGVATLGQMVVTLRAEVDQLHEDQKTWRSRWSYVLRMIGDITAIITDAPSDIRSKVQAVFEQFRQDTDGS